MAATPQPALLASFAAGASLGLVVAGIVAYITSSRTASYTPSSVVPLSRATLRAAAAAAPTAAVASSSPLSSAPAAASSSSSAAAAAVALSPENQPGEDSDSDDEYDSDDDALLDPAAFQCKMVMCVRTDLKMKPGKTAAQCGHAVLGAYKRARSKAPLCVRNWERYGQAKVALKINSVEEMKQIEAKAKEAGLITYIVCDAGRTQVEPGSLTVMAIGPAKVDDVDRVTAHLKLY